MIHALTEHLLWRWDAVVKDRWPRPRAIHWLKFGHVGDFPRPYVYFYLFLDGAAEPAIVAKITAERAARARLGRDFDLVRRLRSRVGEDIAPTIPAPIAELPFGAYWVGLEECARGQRFVPALRLGRPGEESRIEGFLRPVVDWLIAFGRTGLGEVEFAGDLYAQAVAEPLERLARFHALGPAESDLLADIVTHMRAYSGRPVRTVALHGDFWPGNIFIDRGRVHIIDWEGYRERDASYHDIYTLLSSFLVAGETSAPEPAASFAATFSRQSWFARLVRREMERYSAALGLDSELVTLMLPMYLVRMATRREPVTPASRAMNAKFAGLLGAYLRALAAGESPEVRPRRAPTAGPSRPARDDHPSPSRS